MRLPIVFMFSGQGSQYYFMGKELYENHGRFRIWMDYCDEIVRPIIGESILGIIFSESKSEPFETLHYSNPALVSIQYSLARVLKEKQFSPSHLMGYSLGEITANILANVLTLEDGLLLSIEMAEHLTRKTSKGGMLAILDDLSLFYREIRLFSSVDLAGVNFDRSFVVSGAQDDIVELRKELNQRNVVVQKLPVSFGFHSYLIDPAEEDVKEGLNKYHFGLPETPVVSCCLADHLQYADESYLWRVMREKIYFKDTLAYLESLGAYIYIDVGPSGTLCNFVKYSLGTGSQSKYYETMNQYGKDLACLVKLDNSLRLLLTDASFQHLDSEKNYRGSRL